MAVRRLGVVQAISVPAGNFTVTWSYGSSLAKLGLLASVLGVLALIALAFTPRRRRPPARCRPGGRSSRRLVMPRSGGGAGPERHDRRVPDTGAVGPAESDAIAGVVELDQRGEGLGGGDGPTVEGRDHVTGQRVQLPTPACSAPPRTTCAPGAPLSVDSTLTPRKPVAPMCTPSELWPDSILLGDGDGGVDRDGVSLGARGLEREAGRGGRVHSEHFACGVDERAARVTRLDVGVDLDQPGQVLRISTVLLGRGDRLVKGRDRAAGDAGRPSDTARVAYADDGLPDANRRPSRRARPLSGPEAPCSWITATSADLS